MFGSTNPFGQSSNSPFGSSLGFGQSNAANNNPFAPKPFGSTTPFGSQQPGGSMFGGTSTGVFGPSQSSPTLTSMPAFGASSSPSFGTSVPAFGASSTPAFGSSAFGQKPAFGGFGSNTAQPSPFGSTFQQSQPAFGNNMFGSSNQFSASSQPAFGASSTPAFGATSTPAFGSTTSPVFGSTGSVFGVSAAPVFGSGGAFGVSNTPAFGASSTPAFGASSAPSFGFGSSPAFGQSTSAFGSSTFGTSTSPFGAQSSAFGAQATTPSFGSSGFGQSAFGGQRGGSRVASYSSTPEVDGGTSQPAGKLESISAMPVYKEKSHEELRWEDYQLGDKGGPSPAAGQSAVGATGFGATNTQPNPFATSSAFGQSSANAFSSTMSSNPFAPNPSSFGSSGFGSSTTATFGSSPFGASTTSNPFGSSSSGTTSIFSASATTFGSNSSPSLFGSSSTPAFASTPSLFGSGPTPGTTSAFGSGSSFGNTQSSPLFQSTTPSLGQTNPIFGQTGSSFGQSTPAFGQSNFLSTPSTGFGGNLFSSSPSLISTGNPMGFGQTTPAQPAQTAGSFGFGNFGQTQSVGSSGFGGTPSIYGQNTFGQIPPTQSSVVAQPVAVTNPFGTLPAMPQMSIGRSGTAPSVQYGISSLLVVDKPAPARISSLLTSRHLSQRRIRLPARKYVHKNDGPKVPFFIDDEETSTTPKADAVFIPRENPRALVIRPSEQWPPRTNSEKISPLKNMMTPNYNNGNASRVVSTSMQESKVANQEKEGNGKEVDGSSLEDKGENGVKKNKEAGILVNEQNGAGIESHIPKLGQSDYYTVPRIQEIAAKERAEPGFCRHVSDFVVGRHGFGSIKFIGSDTDVRGLDIESIVQFNNREVIVYMDETKKPPVGQGLNKPAEVTLLNVKCFDKKTGHQYTQGPKIARYIDMLKKKAEDQGAEFVSYDPIKGEWKFRVNHFSAYRLDDEEKDHRCAC